MALGLPERFNWVWSCPQRQPGQGVAMLHTRPSLHRGWADGLWAPVLGPQPPSWGASAGQLGWGLGSSCKSWMIPPASWYFCFSPQPKSSTSFQVGEWGKQSWPGWGDDSGEAGVSGGRLRGLGDGLVKAAWSLPWASQPPAPAFSPQAQRITS